MGSDLPLEITMQTEGLGGPCPRCEAMNCFIKKGTGNWYTFIACPECLFAYGENAGNMLEETAGMVTGSDVWKDLINAGMISSREEFDSFFNIEDEDDIYTVEAPFNFEDEEDWVTNMCVMSEGSLDILFNAIGELKEANAN